MAIELTRGDEFALITLNRPQALNALSFSLLGDFSRAMQEMNAGAGVVVDERGPMFLARVEDETRACFNHAGEVQAAQLRRDGVYIRRRAIERVEVMDVERERDALVAQLRDDLNRAL